ncbi:hypothetical protein [Variovorax sp. Sphag1AA]|uniref:hypothetical protein n=1 Tax=Variovorax sp. Sphag1AA TaxID=2587027 RepID=UPI001613EAB3|nr:hypothetical protein [Variovorax sp. Sphag1AA]MBB3179667.1 hypothetical protein [Variovorax sp. Sphag1AA]
MSKIDFGIGLALLSLFGATFLSNLLAYLRDRSREVDPITREARELLMRESAAPVPDSPTLSAAHWARLESMQPNWRKAAMQTARRRYDDARSAYARHDFNGELYYPNPALVANAAHELLRMTERF